MEEISSVHNELLERGISITDLYIYDCLINDGCVSSWSDLERTMKRIKEN